MHASPVISPVQSFRSPSFRSFLILFGVAMFAFAILVGMDGYERSFLRLNGIRFSWLDGPMQLVSWLGNGGVAGFVCWLFIRKKDAGTQWQALMALLVSGLLSQLLKAVVFPDWHRPIFLFEGRETVHYFPGQAFQFHSFPSGHSTTAGAMGLILSALCFRGARAGIVVAFLSIFIGYSRIYNGLHFPGDVLAGWILGLGISFTMVMIFRKGIPFPGGLWEHYFPVGLRWVCLILFVYEMNHFPWLPWN